MQLSRSSKLYKFVFGRNNGGIEGFPEPISSKISSALFVLLCLSMCFLKPLSYMMMIIFTAMIHILSFLIDGSLFRGSLLTEGKLVQINPWPTLLGKRISPGIVLMCVYAGYCFLTLPLNESVAIVAMIGLMGMIIKSNINDPDSISLAMDISEKYGPEIDDALRLRYYRTSKVFPSITLVE